MNFDGLKKCFAVLSGRGGRIFALQCLAFSFIAPVTVAAVPADSVAPDSRCAICGMFVAPYENWLAQLRMSDDSVLFFDGVKDLMVFYLDPGDYGKYAQKDVREVWVRDYYTLEWIDGRTALYVIGSDVYGPMGKEFIPFGLRAAAENFLRDHGGGKIVTFAEISSELVRSMRSGMKMRHGSK